MRAKYLLLSSLLFTMSGGLAFPAMEHGLPYAEAILGACVATAVLLLAFGVERAGMEWEAEMWTDGSEARAKVLADAMCATKDILLGSWEKRDADELVRLRAMVKGLVDRIGAQSELLARCAERANERSAWPTINEELGRELGSVLTGKCQACDGAGEVRDVLDGAWDRCKACGGSGGDNPVGDEWAPKLEAE